jgi:hypothetical protein
MSVSRRPPVAPSIKSEKEPTSLKVISSSIKFDQVRCCICNRLHDRGAYGAGHEIGRNRRFCPHCMSDILITNGIHPDQFPPDDE